MTSHRLSLTLILIAVAVAGIIVGYTLAGWDDGLPQTQGQAPDTMPLLEAIATSVAPLPTPTSVPFCGDPDVPSGTVCLPAAEATVLPCPAPNELQPDRGFVPCRKQ